MFNIYTYTRVYMYILRTIVTSLLLILNVFLTLRRVLAVSRHESLPVETANESKIISSLCHNDEQ